MSIAQVAVGRGRPASLSRTVGGGFISWLAMGVCGATVVVAIFGPAFAPHSPTAVDVSNVFAPASAEHWLGTDDTGRDVASRLIIGARASLAGPALVVLLSGFLATLLAIAAAWRGGLLDATVARIVELMFCFPGLLLAVVVAAIFGAGFAAPVLALSVAYIPILTRVLRAAAIRERNLPYIAALQVQGASSWAICFRHLLPNLFPLIVVQATIGFGYAMLDLAAISYLGVGTQPPTPDWGIMVADGQAAILQGFPQQSLYAGAVVVLVVVSVNVVGERLARRFEIEESL